ncbi:hypothetical protein PC128_g17621 [Phytophthora cactorum]|nr:hypothetical protein PC120_g6501 [Phytophthora cactorum]KAG3065524.1 hypothetical protein PC121_g11327 [Phytophthora cactorum]KAG3175703.1 hypothetical protein PC128_g17621 [Phytophthora cactorum]KAG4049642.1 hypothetical protein PC123_g15093 [Phytophthora cactorum]
MAAVAFARLSVRNARLNYKNPEFELIAQGYKRANSNANRKQPVTATMLLGMRRVLQDRHAVMDRDHSELLWGSIILAFFFLDRSSELWGATTGGNSGNGSTHCVKGEDMTLCNQHGEAIVPGTGSANSVEIFFRSHKGNQRRQMTTLRHYRSGQQALRLVVAVEACWDVRLRWQRAGKCFGQYITSVSTTTTIRKTEVSSLIKEAAGRVGDNPDNYATHSM